MKEPLFLLDGHGFIFRSYHAHIHNPLKNSKGETTSAIYGFFQALKKTYHEYQPKRLIVALDSEFPSFRKTIYTDYKANRPETPEDLKAQIPKITAILQAMQVPTLSVPSMEADDIIATIAMQHAHEHTPVTIVSSDKDLFQLVSEHICILRPTSKNTQWEPIDAAWIQKQYGIMPNQIRDYLAIVGDSSDNIPGIKGLGPKSATLLLQQYGTIDNIYQNIDQIKETFRKKLIASKASVAMSKTLVDLRYDVTIPDSFDAFYPSPLWDKAKALFEESSITTFISRTNTTRTDTTQKAQDTDATPAPRTEHTENSTKISTFTPTHATYTLISHTKELDTILQQAHTQGYLCIDLETDQLNARYAHPVGIALSVKEHEGWYIDLHSQHINPSLSEQTVQNMIRTVFEDEHCTIIMHNAKFDLTVLQRWGIIRSINTNTTMCPITLFDTMIAAKMCLPKNLSYGLDDLAHTLLSYATIKYSDLTDEHNAPPITFADVPLSQAVPYASEDADITLRLYHKLLPMLEQQQLKQLFLQVEMPLTRLIVDMETHGMLVDAKQLKALSLQFTEQMRVLEKEIYEISGESFNINSPKQIQDILFTKLGLPNTKKTKTGLSTDSESLKYLANFSPLPKKILTYRHLGKLKNTYSDTLPLQIDEHTRRIHTSLHQIGAETGRMSSNRPNLQNIPITDASGQAIRSAFIAPKGYHLISADYSQIELVILAHLSQDTNLLEAFRNNVDIHTRTAAVLLGKTEEAISESDRRIAKSINFGIIYGMSPFRLSNDLNISQASAKEFIAAYFTEFDGVTKFIEKTIQNTEELGYTTTILGRRRIIDHINTANKTLKRAAERMAVNTIIQGSAADIMKLAMIAVDNALAQQQVTSKIIMQIHDELLLESPIEESERVMDILRNTMTGVYTLSAPLRVAVNSGTNWGVLK